MKDSAELCVLLSFRRECMVLVLHLQKIILKASLSQIECCMAQEPKQETSNCILPSGCRLARNAREIDGSILLHRSVRLRHWIYDETVHTKDRKTPAAYCPSL